MPAMDAAIGAMADEGVEEMRGGADEMRGGRLLGAIVTPPYIGRPA